MSESVLLVMETGSQQSFLMLAKPHEVSSAFCVSQQEHK